MVRITRAPFVPDTEWSAYYHEITEGWLSFLQQLRFMYEEHPGEARRTLFLSGTGTGALAALEESIPTEAGQAWYSRRAPARDGASAARARTADHGAETSRHR